MSGSSVLCGPKAARGCRAQRAEPRWALRRANQALCQKPQELRRILEFTTFGEKRRAVNTTLGSEAAHTLDDQRDTDDPQDCRHELAMVRDGPVV